MLATPRRRRSGRERALIDSLETVTADDPVARRGGRERARPAPAPCAPLIGRSPGFQRALELARLVAPTTTAVLITGETGTGKELIARALHQQSPRRAGPFVPVNCAAIPSGLLESDLFGHERGAFTGAVAARAGRFELADQGTLFLDEVGELPLELQPKLLRVLQEQSFERLGSPRSRQVDVRVIAATNRDLTRLVREGRFREDLYYRLSVFPLHVPPLRERAGDVPLLVEHVLRQLARRLGRPLPSVPAPLLRALEAHPWPGNVRELQNVLERALILTTGQTLALAPHELGAASGAPAPSGRLTLDELQRLHIMRTLDETGWVIGGPKGAAHLLGLRRTSLLYRMEKLGISRPGSTPAPLEERP